MQSKDKIVEAKAEAKRFLLRVSEWEKVQGTYTIEGSDYLHRIGTPRESGAVRRASMDLTRSLAKLRRYGA